MYFTWVLLFMVNMDGLRPSQIGDLKEGAVYRYGVYNNSLECKHEVDKLNALPSIDAECIKVKSDKHPT